MVSSLVRHGGFTSDADAAFIRAGMSRVVVFSGTVALSPA
jgi:hypothetical protein